MKDIVYFFDKLQLKKIKSSSKTGYLSKLSAALFLLQVSSALGGVDNSEALMNQLFEYMDSHKDKPTVRYGGFRVIDRCSFAFDNLNADGLPVMTNTYNLTNIVVNVSETKNSPTPSLRQSAEQYPFITYFGGLYDANNWTMNIKGIGPSKASAFHYFRTKSDAVEFEKMLIKLQAFCQTHR